MVRGVPGGFTSGSSENVLVLLNGLKLNENVTGGAFGGQPGHARGQHQAHRDRARPGRRAPTARARTWPSSTSSPRASTPSAATSSPWAAGSFRAFLYNFRYGTTFHEVSLAGFLQYSYTGGPELDDPARRADRHRPRARPAGHRARVARARADGGRPQGAWTRTSPWPTASFGINVAPEEGGRGRLRGAARRARASRTASATPRSPWPRTGAAPSRLGDAAGEGRLQPQPELPALLRRATRRASPSFPRDRGIIRFPGGVGFQRA